MERRTAADARTVPGRGPRARLRHRRRASSRTPTWPPRSTRSGRAPARSRGRRTASDALEQALVNRLKTRKGELAPLGHPDYGSRHHELIGEPNVERTRNLIKLYVLQALRDEPRIEQVLKVDVRAPTRAAARHGAHRARACASSASPTRSISSCPSRWRWAHELRRGALRAVRRRPAHRADRRRRSARASVFLPEQAPYRLAAASRWRPRPCASSAWPAAPTAASSAAAISCWAPTARSSGRRRPTARRRRCGLAGPRHAVLSPTTRRVPDFSAVPRLTDRNPGSVTRLLAESFAREYAVLSRQLEAVYEAAFLDTATGRDLDNLARAGRPRRGTARPSRPAAWCSAARVRRRPTSSILAGTRVSTTDAAPAVFETEAATDAAPRRAQRRGPDRRAGSRQRRRGCGRPDRRDQPADPRRRPGRESAARPASPPPPKPTRRCARRARRALDHAGRATAGALIGALSGLPGVREKDVLISDDPVARPGIVEVKVALPEMSEARARFRGRARGRTDRGDASGGRAGARQHRRAAPARPGRARPGPGRRCR